MLRLQRRRVHPRGRALHGVEDVDPRLDEGVEERGDRAAGVEEDLPRRVAVHPVVELLVERLPELVEELRRAERPLLAAEVGPAHHEHLDPVAHDLAVELEVRERDVGLDVEDPLDVVGVGEEVLVPEVRVAQALRVGEPGAGHVGDVADPALPEVADEGVVGLRVEPARGLLEVPEVLVRVGLELLGPVPGVEPLLVDRVLAHDRVEVVAALRQAPRRFRRPVALRVDEGVAVRVHVDLEVARDEPRGAVGERPGLPALVAEAEHVRRVPDADRVDAECPAHRLLQLGEDLERLADRHRVVAEAEGLPDPVVGAGGDAGDRRAAEVDRRSVGLLAPQRLPDPLASVHGVLTRRRGGGRGPRRRPRPRRSRRRRSRSPACR